MAGAGAGMKTLAQCEEKLGVAAIGAASCLKVYGHATTKGARGIKIAPSVHPIVAWIPSRCEPADGGTIVAMNIAQWLRSRDEKVDDKEKTMFECKGLLRPCFEVSLGMVDKTLSPSNKVAGNPMHLFLAKTLHRNAKSIVSL